MCATAVATSAVAAVATSAVASLGSVEVSAEGSAAVAATESTPTQVGVDTTTGALPGVIFVDLLLLLLLEVPVATPAGSDPPGLAATVLPAGTFAPVL